MASQNRRPLAVTTGASSGIGLELARQCVEHDFDVLICAKDPDGLTPAAQHLSATGANVHTVAADLSTIEGCEKLVAAMTHCFSTRASGSEVRSSRTSSRTRWR